MVPPASGRIPPVPPYSGYHPASRGFRIRDCHPLRYNFPEIFRYPFDIIWWSYNPENALTFSVWAMPLSLTTTRGITVVFSSSPYLDVSVRGVRLHLMWITHLQCVGLPHSDIQGSTLICSYPWLFAACHVLLRLREPRHPPHALGYFTYPNDTAALCAASLVFGLLYCSREKSS